MAKFNLNLNQKYKQYKNLGALVAGVVVVLLALLTVFSDTGTKIDAKEKKNEFSGVLDDTFSQSDAQSAMTAQQLELKELKSQFATMKKEAAKREQNRSSLIEKKQQEMEALLTKKLTSQISNEKNNQAGKEAGIKLASNAPFPSLSFSQIEPPKPKVSHKLNKHHRINTVNFTYAIPKSKVGIQGKTEKNYVPSGTFVKAVVLGGADADASVDGVRKNNGVMLFKLINQGTLPNNKRSNLKGCFVTASTYGDISSERAYVALDKISCAQKGRPIIDKQVTGWAFFAGKVGIKGHPVMRDGKVVQWAGISGALSGIASAAQYAQSIQSITPYGAASVIPSSKIGPYAGLGGASKAAEQLSSYYIKRAEQYHPVIQVGAGNLVNIVFKDGFSLLPDSDNGRFVEAEARKKTVLSNQAKDLGIPAEIIEQINSSQGQLGLGSQMSTGG